MESGINTSREIIYGVSWDIVKFINYVLCEDLKLDDEWVDYCDAIRMMELAMQFNNRHGQKLT